MSFVITIDVRDNEARSKTRAIGDELKGTEGAAKRTGAAMTSAGREGAAELGRAAKAVQTLGHAFQGIGAAILREQLGSVSNALTGLTAQFQRESEVLERIRGPMREYQADVQALEMLHRKGMITAQEYSSELAKMASRPGVTAPAIAPAPTVASQPMIGEGLSSLVSGGAAIAAAHEVGKLGDEFLTLKNRLRAVATDEDNVNSLMGQTRTIANDTRTDWESTVNVYTRLQLALRATGASQSEVLQTTKSLSQGLQIGGATAFEAQMTMMEFSHALQAGTLQGREFRVMMKDAAPLMAELQKASGKTAAEFVEMGKHGQISAALIMEWMGKASGSIEEKFNRTMPTLAQQWTVFKNDLVATIGPLVESSKVIPMIGHALQDVIGILGPIIGGLGKFAGALDFVSEKAKALANVVGIDLHLGLGTVVGALVGGPVGAALGTFAEGFVRADTSMGNFMLSLGRFASGVPIATNAIDAFRMGVAAATDPVSMLTTRLDHLHASLNGIAHSMADTTALAAGLGAFASSKQLLDTTITGLKGENEIFERLHGNQVKHVLEIDSIVRAYAAMKMGTSEFVAQLAITEKKFNDVGKAARGMNIADVFGDVSARGLKDTIALLKEAEKAAAELAKTQERLRHLVEGASSGAAAEAAKEGQRSAKEIDNMANQLAKALGGGASGAADEGKRTAEEWQKKADAIVSALQPVEDMLVNMAQTGELSWKKMINSMILEIEQLSAHMLVKGLVSSALHLGGDSPIPGGATGGSWIVGGSGGTDSSIAMLRASPGERLTVETQQQQAANDAARGGGSWSGPMKVQIVDGRDRRGLLRGDDSVTRVVLDDMAKNPRRYRSVLGRS